LRFVDIGLSQNYKARKQGKRYRWNLCTHTRAHTWAWSYMQHAGWPRFHAQQPYA